MHRIAWHEVRQYGCLIVALHVQNFVVVGRSPAVHQPHTRTPGLLAQGQELESRLALHVFKVFILPTRAKHRGKDRGVLVNQFTNSLTIC